MKSAVQLRPMVVAVSSALTLVAASAYAQTFDVNSAAVRQAYAGAATQEKKDAALAGFTQLINALRCLRNCDGIGGTDTIGVRITATDSSSPAYTGYPIPVLPGFGTTLIATKDSDLGPPGVPFSLNFSTLPQTIPGYLSVGASFATPRDFEIGPGGGMIGTNGHDLTISGRVTAQGTLIIIFGGSLSLSGPNVWNGNTIALFNGTLRGDANSLNAPILNQGPNSSAFPGSNLVEFNQTVDTVHAPAIYGSGAFLKTGQGTLTLTGKNDIQGGTRIEQGTLAIAGAGTLSNSPLRGNVFIDTNSTLDFSTVDGDREVGTLSGKGNLKLGKFLLTSGEADRGIGGASVDANTTFGGVISGAGGLGKDGRGTLTLTAANDYTGVTSVLSGTLALSGAGRINSLSSLLVNGTFDISSADGDRSAGSLSGAGNVRIGANNLVVGHDNSNTSFQGTIEGQGGFTKTGSGTLTLYGTGAPQNFDRVYTQARYEGATVIESGTLVAGLSGISSNVINRGTLRLVQVHQDVGIYSGTISGTGQLIKDGDGIIWLRASNTYSGGTEVKDGILIGNTDSLQGNITNNAALAFYQIDNGTYAGTLSGSGTLLQYGPGMLTLTGNNTYTGGTAFSGTLRVDRDANLGAARGALVMAGGTLQIGADMTTARPIALTADGGTIDTNGYRLTASGIIAGNGALTKTGAGTLALDGANALIGGTAVNAGRLEVNGLIVSHVAVAAGAEWGGTGFIAGNVVNNGRLSRGNGIGDVNVAGDVTFAPGSVFTVKMDAAGNSDRLVLSAISLRQGPTKPSDLTARAFLNGGTVDVRAESGNYRRETRYGIVSAQGGVTGQFAGVTSNLAFLDPSLSYDPNTVYLTLKRNDLNYAAVAQTANQTAVAQGLTSLSTVPTGDAALVIAALDGLSASQARAAFDSIGAAGRAALPQVGSLNQRSVTQNLVTRLGIAEGGNTLAPATGLAGRAVQIAFDEQVRSDAPSVYAQAMVPGGGQGLRAGANSDTNNGFWLRGYGGAGRLDGDANAPGAKYNFGGTLFGYDRKVSQGAIVGVFGGYAEPRYHQDVATSSAYSKTYQLGGYGRFSSGAWHVDGVASYARNSTDTSRSVTVGVLNRVASGSYKGDTVAVHLETGYAIKTSGFEVQPLAALSWVRQTQNAYSETGAGALSLVLPDQNQQSLRSSIGARSLHPFQAGTTHAVFEARAAWSHEFSNTRNVSARLAGDPASSVFNISGPSQQRDSAVIGAGLAARASRDLRFYADLSGEFNGRGRAGTLSVELRYQW